MKTTLLATAIAAVFGLSHVAMAAGVDQDAAQRTRTGDNTSTINNTNTETSSKTDSSSYSKTSTDSSTYARTSTDSSTNYKNTGAARATGARSVALNNGSSGSFTNAFNVSSATALSKLDGAVTGNSVSNIGN